MNILLMSMPDAPSVVLHEAAVHPPNPGIAGIGANLVPEHEARNLEFPAEEIRRAGENAEPTTQRAAPPAEGAALRHVTAAAGA